MATHFGHRDIAQITLVQNTNCCRAVQWFAVHTAKTFAVHTPETFGVHTAETSAVDRAETSAGHTAETSAVDKAETFAVHTERSSSNDKAETPAFDKTETPLWGQISRIHNPDPYLCFPPRLDDINNYQGIFYWIEGATGVSKGYRAVRSSGLACDQDPRKKFKLLSCTFFSS